MNDRPLTASKNDLRLGMLKSAETHLGKAREYIEYAMTNGQADIQLNGFVSANRAISEADNEIAAAKDCIRQATDIPC